MNIAIMQPYLFPYIGYFQLINSVDKFVLYNDAQFIKGGWINRNNILINNKSHLFHFSLKKESTYSSINKREFDKQKLELEKLKFSKSLTISYSKAPYFEETYDLINSILNSFDISLSISIHNSLQKIAKHLNIHTSFINSEELIFNKEGNAQEKVIDICKELKADTYLNPIGGRELYSNKYFNIHGVKLKFLKSKQIKYEQFRNEFIPNLSIIDVLMFNGHVRTTSFLYEFELL